MVTPPAPTIAQRLGQYDLLEFIGRGGMGVVWKAQHRHLDQTVAIKFLAPGYWTDPQAIARFYREMRAVGRVVHPNLVRALDAGEYDGHHVLVMEFLSGTTSRDVVATLKTIPVADACEIVRQASTAVGAIAAAGITHRDLKPSNLFLTTDGTVKVMDLGLARFHGDGHERDLTVGGDQLGTIDYMAPEQSADPRGVDVRTDLYSLGCTLFALLTGQAPFAGGDHQGLESRLRAHREVIAPDPRTLRPDLPPGLCELVATLLAKNPADRLASAEELTRRLTPFAQGADLAVLMQRVQPEPRGAAAEPADRAGETSRPGRPVVETSEVPISPDATTPREKQALALVERPPAKSLVTKRLLVIGLVAALSAGAATGWHFYSSRAGISVPPAPAPSPDKPDGNKSPEPSPAPVPDEPPQLIDYSNTPLAQLNDLLDNRPVPVYWTDNGGADFATWNAPKREFTVSNRETGLFALGALNSDNYSFETQLHQIGWSGGVGVFFGLKGWKVDWKEPGWSCYCLMVEMSEDARANRTHRLVFSRMTSVRGVDRAVDFEFEKEASQIVKSLRGEAALDLTIRRGRIDRIIFAGQELDELRTDINEVAPRVNWSGPLGVIVTHGASTYRKVRLQLLDSGQR